MSDSGHTERLEAALDGKYRIERKLGEGGMATVYLAEDIKHERKVALKILKPELAAVIGTERFLSEIKTTAALQHPHILPLHDSGEASGYLYYVMPYIDGETLREKLDREKQLGVEEAVRIARDVADALDYAHRAGVIHRDIKPGNILLHDGRPVVADFGIALAVSAAGGGRMTETGLSLGTPHYMSPEQASADRDLSPKSDVYSLGCVLYEMLAGQPPHTGPSAQSILVHILTKDVTPLTELRHTVPANVAATVSKAIEKLPADRFETAKEFSRALGNDAFRHEVRRDIAPVSVEAEVAEVDRSGPWRRLSMTLATLLVLSIGVGGWALLAPQSSEYMSRYLLSDEGWNVDEGSLARQGAISPDGSTWILPVDGEEDSRLAFKARGTTDLTPIAGTEGAHGVAVSPDGEWILFGQGTNLVKRPLVGGTAEILAEDTEQPIYTFALAWLDDGTILYEDFGAGPMRRIRHLSEDGQPLSLFLDDGHGFSAAWISGLPGARGALVTGCAGSGGCQPDENDLFLLALDDASFVPLVEQVVRAWYVPTGHIVYVQADGAVFAVPFDVGSMEVTGQPTPLLEGVRIAAVAADMVLGADGTALYWEGAAIGRGQAPVWVARDGSQQVLDTLLSGEFGAPAVSPDGRMVAFEYQVLSEENPGIDIWVYSIDAGTFNRITVEGQSNRHPFWSPDGLAIAFSSGRNGLVALYSRPIDLSSPSRVLAADPEGDMWEGAWTADGRSLVYRRGEGDIVVRPASPDSKAELIAATEARERNPAVSRDGSWLAYVSDESGRDEVYVRPLAARGGRAQISVAGGRGPVWSAAGEVLYSSGDALISATIREEPELAFERREQLLDLRPYVQRETHPYFDVSADGERLLSISRGDGSEQRALGTEDRLVVIENFFLQLEPALVQD